MAFRPSQRPRLELAKSVLGLVMSLAVLAYISLNGPPQNTPSPTGLLVMLGLVVVVSALLTVKSYREYVAQKTDSD